jgi:ribosomal protein L16 Arg81 hydroxylase
MNAFSRLLSPFDSTLFFGEYWRCAPLYVPGDEGKFANFPGMKDLPSLLSGRFSANNRWLGGHIRSAQATFVDKAGNFKQVNAGATMWPDLFNAGASLCFSAVDQSNEELTRFVQDIASTTQFPGTIVTTCYLTPPSSGSGMHFDSQHVFFMQVGGKKHWKFSPRPAWQDAAANLQLSSLKTPTMKTFMESSKMAIANPAETGLQEITLNTGDVLYLPPGFWHEGRTSDSPSLHYTLTFMPLGPWHLLVPYLRRSVFEKASMRRDVRYAAESGDSNARRLLDAAIADLREIINHLTADDVERFFLETSTVDSPFKDYLLQS